MFGLVEWRNRKVLRPGHAAAVGQTKDDKCTDCPIALHQSISVYWQPVNYPKCHVLWYAD